MTAVPGKGGRVGFDRQSDPEVGFGYHSGLLREGECIRMSNGTLHFIQYVNSSGAYAVPLAAITREIKGTSVAFTAGGRTISAHSLVDHIHPLTMGGSSPEYKRYVTMARALKGGTVGGKGSKGKVSPAIGDTDIMTDKGAPVGAFDTTNLSPEAEAAEGHAADLASQPPTVSGIDEDSMAKKAKAGKAGKASSGKAGKTARAPKPPKTVRNCACACGTETTGYFAPGHDARMHGWIAKLADGRIEPKDIPASVRAKLELMATKEGFKAKNPNFWKVD